MSQPTPSAHSQMRCAEAERYLSAYVDGELTEPLHSQVAAHVATCAQCARKVASYQRTTNLLASLPQTAPSEEVFDRVLMALPQRYAEPAKRESLIEWPSFASLRRRLTTLEQPEESGEEQPSARPRLRRGGQPWAVRALPVVAAVLLVSLALGIFSRFVSPATQPVIHTPTPIPGPVLQATDAQVALLANQLAFTPVLPTYLPPSARLVSASASGHGLSAYLDITWTVPGSIGQVHAREARTSGTSACIGYQWATANAALSWQLSAFQPWRPLKRLDNSSLPAVGQTRGDICVALDASGAASADFATQTLRKISLSLDAPYHLVDMKALQGFNTQTLNYKLVGRDASGHTIWQATGYWNSLQNRQRIEVYSASGALRYTDIINQGAVLRLDNVNHTYESARVADLGLSAWTTMSKIEAILLNAQTYASVGKLWYTGPTSYQGHPAYDLELVDAPIPTHFYVDAATKALLAVEAKVGTTTQPGGPAATDPFGAPLACANYTLLQLLPSASGSIPADVFSQAVPDNLTYGTTIAGTVLSTVGC